MAGTVYFADVLTPGIRNEIAGAQDVLDGHRSGLDGLCRACRVISPCAHRELAVAVFFRYFGLCLPRRGAGPVAPEPVLPQLDWFASRA